MIRYARMGDVKEIHSLINYYARQGLLLPCSLSSLYDRLRDFVVHVHRDDSIIGVCALHITWENLAEIRSLAVREGNRGQRIGAELVRQCLVEADMLGIAKVFTLTYQPGFFHKQGFHDIDKRELPHKIWSDCINCHMFPDCDEEALMYDRQKS
ncbi:MAG: N-acetyltransferase [Desulfopila sp.]